MALTDESKLETFMGISFTGTSSPTSTEITAIIVLASKRVMRDVTRRVKREKNLDFLPKWAGNKDGDWGQTNGSNKVFFMKNVPLADFDNDGTYTDDIRVDILDTDTDGWSENATVSAVDQRRGKVTLTTAPSNNDDVYMDYYYYPGGEAPDTQMIEIAATAWASYLVLQNKSTEVATKIANYTFGGHTVSKESIVNLSKMKSDEYKTIYKQAISEITEGMYEGE